MSVCEHLGEQPLRFPAQDYITGQAFSVHTCRACGLVLTLPVPSPEAMSAHYPEAYYGTIEGQRFPGLVETLQARLYRRRVRRLEGLLRSGVRRVLDVGCGKGFLLEAFRSRGWAGVGLERTPYAARYGREVLGLDIRTGTLWDEALAGGRFDAAVLWHVLEHVPDPARWLVRLAALLEPGGLILVSVPNLGSPEARLAGADWFHLDVPRHLVHFTRATLEQQMEEAGFEVVEQWRYAPEFDLFSFIQSALNRLGLPFNLLYRQLRGVGAQLPGARDKGWHRLASFALAVPLGLLGLVATTLLGAAGQGSTLTVVGRKKASS